MIEYFRNLSDKIISKILMALLIFSFIGWGVAEWLFNINTRNTTLVTIDGQSISIEEFNKEKARTLLRLSKSEQKEIYKKDENLKIFHNSIIQKLISNKLLEIHAKNIGIDISDKQLAIETIKYPDFQEKGKFSANLFDLVLYHTGFTEKSFKDFLKNEMMRVYLINPMLFINNVPNFYIESIYNSRNKEKEIEWTSIDLNSIKITNPTNQELTDFYNKNPILLPEMRDIEYILIKADMSKPDQMDETYDISLKIEDALIGGENLSDLVKKYKNIKYTKLNKIKLDFKNLDKNLLNQLFNIDEDEITAIIETKEGYVIGKVNKIYKSEKADFNIVKKDLINKYIKEEQNKKAYLKANDILVNKIKLKNKSIVSRTKGFDISVLTTIFNIKEGVPTIVKGSNAFYVIKVNKTINKKPGQKELQKLKIDGINIFKQILLSDYNSYLLRKYKIKFNKRAFDKLFK